MAIMKRIRRLFSKTKTYHRLSEKPSLSTLGSFANSNKMSTASPDQPKKSSSVFEKLGQRITNIKEDIADEIERRKQSYNSANNNQVHFTTRTNQAEDSLIIEKKAPIQTEIRQRLPSGDDGSISERSFSFSKSSLTMSVGRKPSNETVSTPTALSNSFQDIFFSENSEQAKDMIMNNIRHEINLSQSQTISESGSDDYITNRVDHVDTSVIKIDKNKRKPTMLLAGPKFRCHTVQSEHNLKRNTIYPVSCIVGAISIIIILWKPISPFLSGYILGFISAAAITYIIIQIYLSAKANETSVHEWIDFPELESILQEKVVKEDKNTSLHTCCEVVFGRYDADRDNEFIRYPAVIHLDNYRLSIQLPTKAISEENKDKEIRFVGFREYILKEANLILVPEATLTRIKYWLNEYPIVLQNLHILNKQIINKQFYEKSKFDTDDFFNNSHTTISLFFETGPDKEDWFHKLSLVLRKGKEEIEHPKLASHVSSPTLNTIAHSISDTQIPTLGSRAAQMHSNTVNLENRVQMKSAEIVGPPYADTISIDKSETETFRSQINEVDILSDMTQARIGAQELRKDILETEKKISEKDSDKDSTGAYRTPLIKKKFRKQEENLHRLLNSPDCLDEAAITLNFLTRRLFCDIFQEPLFKDLLKEKIELKLKEIAVSVLEDLRVETIDMGNTFPVILKVEPMQWNTKGIWFSLFLFYRGSFNFTIKTRLVLQRLLNYNPVSDQPMHYQHNSAQIVHKDDERIENDDLTQRQKLLPREPELPENAAARKIGTLLTKVASNKHFQRFAALKPVAGVIEKLSNAEIGANIELMNFSGIMTINIPPPPSDRIWIGFSEMPDLNLKVTPVFGESKYSYTLIHDFLEARIRDEIKRLLVLPSMDDQLLPFFRDWVMDVIGELASKSSSRDLNRAGSEES